MTTTSGRSTGDGDAVTVRALVKRYRAPAAVDHIDLDIPTGEVFALLGPNGAGKTTTVEILGGYRRRDAGELSVLGVDRAPAASTGGPGSGSSCRTPPRTPSSPSRRWSGTRRCTTPRRGTRSR